MPSRKQLEQEVVRLKELRADVEKDWLRLRYLPPLALLAIPAYFLMDMVGAAGVIVSVISVFLPAAYLLGTRRLEYDSDIQSMERAILMGMYDSPSADSSN